MSADEELKTPGLLVAMPNMNDPVFRHSVVLLTEYTTEYAFGFITNQPSGSKIEEIFKNEYELGCDPNTPLLVGGPVQLDFLWVLHSSDVVFESTKHITDTLCVSAFIDFNNEALKGKRPKTFHVGFGYAGWGAGQLDRELKEGSWWLTELDHPLLLELDYEKRWKASLDIIGISPQVTFYATGEA